MCDDKKREQSELCEWWKWSERGQELASQFRRMAGPPIFMHDMAGVERKEHDLFGRTAVILWQDRSKGRVVST